MSKRKGKTVMKRRVACLFAVVAIAATAEVPKTATIIPAPREIRATGGEYSCNRDGFKFNRKKLYNNVYCFGNPDTFHFLEKVLDYVCELFPSEVIHIGGDECSRGNWKACPKCQAFIKEKGLKGVEDIQPAARKNVVGGQCCNWSTHTFCLEGLEWKMWPRGFALAEVLWTYPDPAKRDFKEFEERAANYRRRLIGAHVNCAPLK